MKWTSWDVNFIKCNWVEIDLKYPWFMILYMTFIRYTFPWSTYIMKYYVDKYLLTNNLITVAYSQWNITFIPCRLHVKIIFLCFVTNMVSYFLRKRFVIYCFFGVPLHHNCMTWYIIILSPKIIDQIMDHFCLFVIF